MSNPVDKAILNNFDRPMGGECLTCGSLFMWSEGGDACPACLSKQVKIKLLDKNAKLPTKGTEDAAGYDLYSSEAIMARKGCTTFIPTGIAIELPKGYAGFIHSRSGLTKEWGLVVANGVGVIDSDYRGEVGVLIYNQGKYDKILEAGTRVAQLVIQEVPEVTLVEVSELNDTDRGQGGFGSTGG